MSEITTKFCEECGKTSPIAVKYCKFCGAEFPKIDHPEYIQTNFPREQPPQQSIPPQYQQMPYIENPQYQPPQRVQQPRIPSQYTMPPPGQQMGQEYLQRKPPRAWEGGGLFSAIKSIYTKPNETTLAIVEDPLAPSSFVIVLFAALFSSLATFITYSKLHLSEYENDDEGTLNPYITGDGLRDYAVNQAVFSFLAIFMGWFLLSWLLRLVIKGGIPEDQYLLNAPSKSMRQFTGFLYVPLIIKNLIKIILLQFENDRDIKMTVLDTIGISGPNIEFLSDFSSQYISIMTIIFVISVLITTFVFYRSTRFGMNHNGITPVVGVLFIFIVHYFLFIILGP